MCERDLQNLNINDPTIVLVRPQMGENIGAVARAMCNFGLYELRLVSPRDADSWLSSAAFAMASGADKILENAIIYDSLRNAVADCNFVCATSARARDMQIPSFSPRESANMLCTESVGKSALVFGGERAGLSNEDILCANQLISIPTNPDFRSLNLAQSVIVIAYEWYQAKSCYNRSHATADGQERKDEGRALHKLVDSMLEDLVARLDKCNFFHETNRKARCMMLETLFRRHTFSNNEIHALRGVFKALSNVPRLYDSETDR